MNRIKRILAERGIKQKSLADQLNKSYNMTNSYVQNRRQPSIEDLYRIAKILNVSVRILLEETFHETISSRRKKYRIAFICKHMDICNKTFTKDFSHSDYNTPCGRRIVELARKELSYKNTTYSGDIYWTIGREYLSLLESIK